MISFLRKILFFIGCAISCVGISMFLFPPPVIFYGLGLTFLGCIIAHWIGQEPDWEGWKMD